MKHKDRRTSLKLLLASGLTSRWVTPSILSISLPAHAQTSAPSSAQASAICDPFEIINIAINVLSATTNQGFTFTATPSANPALFEYSIFNGSGQALTFTSHNDNALLSHASPAFPFTIAPGQTVGFTLNATTPIVATFDTNYEVTRSDGCEGTFNVTSSV